MVSSISVVICIHYFFHILDIERRFTQIQQYIILHVEISYDYEKVQTCHDSVVPNIFIG